MTELVNPWENPIYTNEQMDKLATANREYRKTGYPQKAAAIVSQMERSVPYSEIEMPDSELVSETLRPETPIDTTLIDIPPRVGPGSGHPAWAEFAGLVSDMDEEVIEQFTRNEIIEILVDRDIINAE